ncbi:MAG: fibronectin type III domain-containing protein [Thermoleophilia bacterium]
MSRTRLKTFALASIVSTIFFFSVILAIYIAPAEKYVNLVDSGADILTGFRITEDVAKGYVTAENDRVKVVWHYKILWGEYNNRGGGNIYELYDKTTDPGMTRNLVAQINDGTAGTSPPKAGIGGLGATYLYEKGYNVAIGDNGGQARLVSENEYIDSNGNAVFEASFIVASKVVPGQDSYRVDKKWTVYPDGQIKLDISMDILRSFEVSQIAYNFSFNRQYGWTEATSRRHFWGVTTCNNEGSGNANNNDLYFADIDKVIDRDNSLMHTQGFTFYGQVSGVAASVKMDNEGGGFESGGLFSLGERLWGTTASPTSEYSNYSQRANGHTVRFYAWWAGDPPLPDRYRNISSGTGWSDTLWIETAQTNRKVMPSIVTQPTVSRITEETAKVEWKTNVAADARLFYRPSGTATYQTLSDASWSPVHNITIEGLSPGVTYEYEVRSKDAVGEAVGNGQFTTIGVGGVSLLPVRSSVEWLNFQDYLDRILTVDFDVTNIGSRQSVSSDVMMVLATSGVSGSAENGNLGDIGSGNSKTLRIKYQIPMGINSFKTTIYMLARDADGQLYYFPAAPPTE